MRGGGDTVSLFADHSYYDLVPKTEGRLREERWGGIYYNHNKLQIDLMNQVAYHILSLCNGHNTVKEIEDAMLAEFDAPADLIKSDLQD